MSVPLRESLANLSGTSYGGPPPTRNRYANLSGTSYGGPPTGNTKGGKKHHTRKNKRKVRKTRKH